jgi:predicted membrane chloride channel (bestrophin family)
LFLCQVTSSYFYGLIPMALTAMVTLGIRELSNTLADPFGSDETDIPVLDYVAKWHAEFDQLLEFVPPGFEREKAETSATSDARL